MLDQQNKGDTEEWPTFMLNRINGLRKCDRLKT